ncbi:uncharacterized protein LOC129921561 [Episyrphus balteatus]|uniref:uncharacterized protein LOC129921561 n=1 Tax=Episyrphus balteatus TaxID=286459 RepID=UPI002486539E|nr:uncharacterized protein LOC129921561 [Episyrphus balteatus]
MTKKISKNVKYTQAELENYTNVDGSCVKKMNTNLHLNILPSGLKNFKQSLLTLLSHKKVGSYDDKMEGIILDIHNVKLIGDSGAIRFDDPKIHLDVVCDCYVFKPVIGAIVKGTVRHVSSSQIGVIIYRVFSVSIRLVNKSNVKIEVNSEIEFRIKHFDMEHVFPYIEGELVNGNELGLENVNNLKRVKIEKEEPEDCKDEIDIIDLIDEIKEDELNESQTISPSKPKKKKKGISFKTEE